MIGSDPTLPETSQNDIFGKNKDSLANQDTGFVTGAEFGANTEGGAISTYNVQNLNFSKMQGGTATLGGTANGSGYLSIKDSSGSEIVKGDSTGLTITGGNINIYNSSGSISFDSLGINSASNFKLTSASPSGTVSCGTTLTPVPGGTLSPIVLTRPTNVLVDLFTFGYNKNVTNDFGYSAVYVCDGVDVLAYTYFAGAYMVAGGTEAIMSQFTSCTSMSQLAAGTHTLIVKTDTDTATGTTVVAAYAEAIQYGY